MDAPVDADWDVFEELVNLSPTPLPNIHLPDTPPVTPSAQDSGTSGHILHNGVTCDTNGCTSFEALRDDDQDYSETRHEYELRPQARELKSGFTSTWVDDDATEDYDPVEERRQQYLRRKLTKIRPQRSHRPVARDAPLVPEETLLVAVSFTSESGRAKFQDLVANLITVPNEQLAGNGYDFRKRKHDVTFTYNDGYDAKRARFAPDLPDDPTGHPFARGCWECVSLGEECPLLADETSWPCTTCLGDGQECELVVPPKTKRACERCKSQRSACSYSYTLNHGLACQQCMESGQKCIAGPAKDSFRTRIRYDCDSAHAPLPNIKDRKPSKARNHDPCVECHTAARPCTFETEGNCGNPCAACLGSGASCTIKSLLPPQQTLPPRPALDTIGGAGKPDEATHKPAQQTNSRNQSSAPTKVVTTKLCHPVIFNYQERTASRKPCHFCPDAAYGIFGLGEKRVEVRETSDGRGGWEEVSDGHRADGVERSRMCPSCCLNRLSIIMCERHELRAIPGLQPTAADTESALVELLSGTPQRQRKWCAICPSLASYQCRAAYEQFLGCGLLLCRQCAGMLSRGHKGDLQPMLSAMTDNLSQEKPFGLRADYGLLKQDGLLMSFMLSGNN